MKTAIYRIHYGFETLYDSIESIYSWADKIIVVVSRIPWYASNYVEYRGKQVQIINPENIDNNISALKQFEKIQVEIEEFNSPLNQWGHLVNKYSSEFVLTLEPDMLFPFEVETTDSVLAWKQVEFWKDKNWRIPQRKRVGPVLYHKPNNIITKFNNLPTNQNYDISEKLTHNVGFCFSKELMLYKHLLSIGFSKKIGDTPPNEDWYEDKWLNWTPETVDLEIAIGYEHYIKKAEKYGT